MANFAADDFSGAATANINGTSLDVGGVWANSAFQNAQAKSSGTNSAYASSATMANNDGFLLASVAPPSADYVVSATVNLKSGIAGTGCGVVARAPATTGNNSGYYATWTASGANIFLYKIVGGTRSTLGSFPFSLSSGSSFLLELKVQGTSLTVSANGSAVITTTDSSFTAAGLVGIQFVTNTTAATTTAGPHLMTFSADTITASGIGAGTVNSTSAVLGSPLALKFGQGTSVSQSYALGSTQMGAAMATSLGGSMALGVASVIARAAGSSIGSSQANATGFRIAILSAAGSSYSTGTVLGVGMVSALAYIFSTQPVATFVGRINTPCQP